MSGLAGKHLVLTRPRETAGCPMADALDRLGARLSWIPLVEIRLVPFAPPGPGEIDWLFFTSRNGVHAYFQHAQRGSARIAAVGPGTAQALQELGQPVDLMPDSYHGRAAAEALAENHPVAGTRILWPCGNLAHPEPAELLRARGAQVETIVVYETRGRETLDEAEIRMLEAPVDAWIFTSPSAVETATALQLVGSGAVACLGPRTAEAAHKRLGRVDILASPHTLAGLQEAILSFFG